MCLSTVPAYHACLLSLHSVPVKWVYPRVSCVLLPSVFLFTFTISVRCVCPMSLFNESVWILLVYKWSSSCVSYWSLPFAALFWIIVVFSLAAAVWFIIVFGWVSNHCMNVLMWSWCDGGSSCQNTIILQCPAPCQHHPAVPSFQESSSFYLVMTSRWDTFNIIWIFLYDVAYMTSRNFRVPFSIFDDFIFW